MDRAKKKQELIKFRGPNWIELITLDEVSFQVTMYSSSFLFLLCSRSTFLLYCESLKTPMRSFFPCLVPRNTSIPASISAGQRYPVYLRSDGPDSDSQIQIEMLDFGRCLLRKYQICPNHVEACCILVNPSIYIITIISSKIKYKFAS